MASIRFSEIYSRFYTKAEAFDIVSADEPVIDSMMEEWVRSALFYPHIQKLFSSFTVESVGDVDIDGRNLLLKTDGIQRSETYDGNNSLYLDYEFSPYFSNIKDEDTAEYTIQFNYKFHGEPVSGATNLGVLINGIYLNGGTGYILVDKDQKGVFNASFVIDTYMRQSSLDNIRIMLRYPNNDNYFEISNLKLEVGNEATVWRTAPEDMDDYIITFVMAYPINDVYDREFILDVLSYGMVYGWVHPKVTSITNITQFFGETDSKFYSQAMHLEQLRALRDDIERKIRGMIRDRGFLQNDYLDGKASSASLR